jgi:transcriptional regulator with XRE-family HTH domain
MPANRSSPVHDAARRSAWVLAELGRELHLARLRAGRTQRQVGSVLRRSHSTISRIEHGKAPRLALRDVMILAAALGHTASTKLFPAGRLPLDRPQLRLLAAFNARIDVRWERRLEAVIPLAGDFRAVDELISRDGTSCAVEAITRLVDVQAQLRSARLKQRDIGATRLVLVISGTRANRRVLAEAADLLTDALPRRTRAALAALAAGVDPGADCLIVL